MQGEGPGGELGRVGSRGSVGSPPQNNLQKDGDLIVLGHLDSAKVAEEE